MLLSVFCGAIPKYGRVMGSVQSVARCNSNQTACAQVHHEPPHFGIILKSLFIKTLNIVIHF